MDNSAWNTTYQIQQPVLGTNMAPTKTHVCTEHRTFHHAHSNPKQVKNSTTVKSSVGLR